MIIEVAAISCGTRSDIACPLWRTGDVYFNSIVLTGAQLPYLVFACYCFDFLKGYVGERWRRGGG